MIKKYNDNYIDIEAVVAVSSIWDSYYDGLKERYSFQIFLSGGAILSIKDNDKARLLALREKLLKDWLSAKSRKNLG